MSTAFTYADLVARVADLGRLALVAPRGERAGLASSFDRASRYDAATDRYLDWGANADGSGVVRKEGEREVLLEVEGPGCIWRIWSATVGEGHVRIYLDGAEEPAVDLPFAAYFDRQHEPFTRPSLVYLTAALGYNNYTPIPFQASCRIVADPRWGKYYHFNYTRFAAGTQVESFRPQLSAAAAAALDRLDQRLARCADRPERADSEQTVAHVLQLTAGQEGVLAELTGAGEIVALRIRVDLPAEVTAQRRRLRELAIRITWDGDERPAVWAPLGDFFGCAAGAVPYATLPLGLRPDGTFYCHWRMPFARGARLEIVNDGADRITVLGELDYLPRADASTDSLRLHAKWHRDLPPVRPDRQPDWTLLQTRGRGRLVGTQLHVWNPRGGWWGEGDEKFFVDGEAFPSVFGTGTEDYLGYAWSSGNTFVQALHSQPVNENNRGHVSANRWHVPDDVPFERAFEAAIEKYFSNANPCHWSAVAYWYLAPGGEDRLAEVPVAERVEEWSAPPLWRAEGAIEAEEMTVRKEPWPHAAGVLDAVVRQLPAGAVSNDRLLI